MRLMTREIENKLKSKPLYSTDEQGLDAECIVKYFNPYGHGVWLFSEGEKQENGDWLLYGLCHIFEWEWGFVQLSELESIKLPFGLTIERDLYSNGTIGELAKQLGYEEHKQSKNESCLEEER